MTSTEFRLFRREPFSVVFVLAFPLMMMVLLAAVFGNNRADAEKIQNGMLIWRGVTPANYYTAASVAVIVAALGLMTLPITLAGYRERGILRRFRASSVPASTLVGSQLTLALVTFVAGTLVMAIVARLAYHAMLPQNVLGVVVALLAGTAAFGAIGLLLATVIRTSRSAQGIGLHAVLRAVAHLGHRAAPSRSTHWPPRRRRPAATCPPRHRRAEPVVRVWLGRHRSRGPGRLRGRSRRPRPVALPLGLSETRRANTARLHRPWHQTRPLSLPGEPGPGCPEVAVRPSPPTR